MAASARETWPLDPEEARFLTENLAATQAALVVAGLLGCAVVSGLSDGAWLSAFVGLGWAQVVARSLASCPAGLALASGLALAAAFLGLGALAERLSWRLDEGAAVKDARRGVNGELPRLALPVIVLLMAMTAVAEELVFRLALLGGLWVGLGMVMPTGLAGLGALVASTFVFWLAHVRYRDFWSSALVLALGLVLGLAFMVSGSLAVVAVAHGAYDLADVLVERRKMARDPDYFLGPAPDRVLLDLVEEEERR